MENNVVVTRKGRILELFNMPELHARIQGLFTKDEKKIESFKNNLIKIAAMQNLNGASVESIFSAALNLAELGLDISPLLGLAYVVKYRTDAQPMVGYKGYLQLAERAGKLVKAQSVFACDDFNFEIDGFNEHVTFKPAFDARDENNRAWFDANFKGVLIRIKDKLSGDVSAHFVSKSKINKLASVSKTLSAPYGPYAEWYEEMFLAKAIKYILSKTPLNEVNAAVAIEDGYVRVEDPVVEAIPEASTDALFKKDITIKPDLDSLLARDSAVSIADAAKIINNKG